jgi:hypothetical protein
MECYSCKITRLELTTTHSIIENKMKCYFLLYYVHGDIFTYLQRGRCGHDHMVVGFITTYTCMQSVPIATNVVSLNPT